MRSVTYPSRSNEFRQWDRRASARTSSNQRKQKLMDLAMERTPGLQTILNIYHQRNWLRAAYVKKTVTQTIRKKVVPISIDTKSQSFFVTASAWPAYF